DLIGFFTTGAPGEAGTADLRADLWSAPLVYAGKDRLLMAVYPFHGGNTRWLLDRWLKRLGFPLDFRGTEFEDFARTSMAGTVAASELAAVSTVHKQPFEFVTASGRSEEIDLL